MRVPPILVTTCALALISCSGLPLRAAAPGREATDARVRSVAAFLEGRATGLSRTQIERVSRVVVREADRTGFTPGLIAAVIHVESSGRNFISSRAGALGLMQVMPETGRAVAERLGLDWAGPQMLFDPEINVHLGIHYLAELYGRFGDLEVALAAYNWGPTYIAEQRRSRSQIPDAYAQRVLRYYERSARDIGLVGLAGEMS
jgi:soluble lytic murein transglycosylase-like protein